MLKKQSNFSLQMLLTNGADPNLKVYNDFNDRNSQLRPVLVEYLASNAHPNLAVVNLLIRYGARVSFVKKKKNIILYRMFQVQVLF